MKFFPLIDQRPSCQEVTAFLWSKKSDCSIVDRPDDADMFLVGGGDGWMLRMMREYGSYGRPFLWVNCGTRWFLLNSFDRDAFTYLSLESIDIIHTYSVQVDISFIDGTCTQWFFVNDITLGWSVLDYFGFTMTYGKTVIHTKGTWLVVCTALWSTWYALNLWQPLLPLESRMWGMSGIATAPFSYSFLQPQKLSIDVSWRYELRVWLDWYNDVYAWVQSVYMTPGEHMYSLAFLQSQAFSEKRVLLAEEKMGR